MNTKEEIFKRILEIDNELALEGFEINKRVLNAILRYKNIYEPNTSSLIFNKNNPSDISFVIKNWYKDRYQEKLNMPLIKHAIFIKNEPYEVEIPTIYGTVDFNWEQVMKYIKGVSPAIIKELTLQEGSEIMFNFISLVNINSFLQDCKDSPLLYIILGDLISSKDYMLHNINNDMQHWQCLQAVEKLLKVYIKKHIDIIPPKTHDLEKLSKLAKIKDPLLLALFNKIQVEPSTRYEKTKNRNDSFDNYKNTIKIFNLMLLIWEEKII